MVMSMKSNLRPVNVDDPKLVVVVVFKPSNRKRETRVCLEQGKYRLVSHSQLPVIRTQHSPVEDSPRSQDKPLVFNIHYP